MWNHYQLFLEKAAFPEDGRDYLLRTAQQVQQTRTKELGQLVDDFYAQDFPIPETEQKLWAMAEADGIEPYTMSLLFLICASKRLREDYARAGYSDELYWDTILDLKTKAVECRDVYGIWGTFVALWYPNFFRMDLFRLGRLQFERNTFHGKEPVTVDGVTVTPGQPVYSVHIPSGLPLDPAQCEESYRIAQAFFAEELQGKPMICQCDSWLLYPDNPVIFSKAANLLAFWHTWHIYGKEDDPKGHDLWRVFGKGLEVGLENLPRNTSMQRDLAAWLEKGGSVGEGGGLRIFS